jgi:tRNA-specific adenosine deaminase 3
MALSLGLGSLFNHDDAAPNVGYTLDKERGIIRYSTKRDILPGEELCIYYGHGVHFGQQGELLVKKDVEPLETEEKVLDSLSSIEVAGTKEADPIVPLKEAPLQLVTNILSPEDMPLELSV